MAKKTPAQLEEELAAALADVAHLTAENAAYKVSVDALTTKAKEDQEFIAKQQREFSVLTAEVERLKPFEKGYADTLDLVTYLRAEVERLKPFEKDLAEALAEIKEVASQAEALKAQITAPSGPSVHADDPLTEDELDLRRRIRAGLTPAQAREAQAAQKAHDAQLLAAAAATPNS